jgi:gamma-glutamyltranspeptidase
MATGSAGGSRIITATLQELYHHIDQGLNGLYFVYLESDSVRGLTEVALQLPSAFTRQGGMINSRA